MSKSKNMQYKVHDIFGVENSVSLAKIGELTPKQLNTVTANFTDCSPIGWTSNVSTDDIAFSKKHNFDINVCISEDEDFVMFGFAKGEYKQSQLKTLLEIYPETSNQVFGVLTCDSYFAHTHHDQETVRSAGQLMFVVENEANHILYSKDSNGVDHTFVPMKGDIVFLDVWCDHAVIPNQSKGLDFMREHGMKLVCFAFD